MNDSISALLAETHNNLREQLDAAQRHFARLEQLLSARDSKDIASLNRAARRLRAAATNDWTNVLVESAAAFCGRAALFSIQGNSLHLESARGSAAPIQLEDVPLDTAPAFNTAVESGDTVVAVRTRGELSAAIAHAFGEDSSGKCRLFPILRGDVAVALLYADGAPETLQPDALELLATLAGMALGKRAPKAVQGLVTVSAFPADRELHVKAQRFARVQVAEMRLHQDAGVKNGRAGRDLYASLQPQIDSAREAYRREFLSGSESVPDYLHQELVHTLAHDDVELLGPDYPGPLV
jgi:hypothetical protein